MVMYLHLEFLQELLYHMVIKIIFHLQGLITLVVQMITGHGRHINLDQEAVIILMNLTRQT